MNGLCNLNNVVYQEIIRQKENIMDKRKSYIGISSTKRKIRNANHKFFFLPMNIWNTK